VQAESLVKARLRAGHTAPEEHVILCTSPPPDDIIVDWNTPTNELLPRLRNVRLGDVGDVQHSVRLALGMWATHTCSGRRDTWLEGQKPWLAESQFILLLTDAGGLEGGVGSSLQGAAAPFAGLLAQHTARSAASSATPAALFVPPSLPRSSCGVSLLTPLGAAGEGASGTVFPQPAACRSLVGALGSHLNNWGTRIYALQLKGHTPGTDEVHGRLHALCAAGGGRAVAVSSLKAALRRVQELLAKLQQTGPKVHLQVGRPGDECTISALSGSGAAPLLLRTRQITPRQLGGDMPGAGVWPIPEPFLPCRGVTAAQEASAGAASSKGGSRRPQQGLEAVPPHVLPPRPPHPTLVLLPDATPHNKEAVAHVLHKLAFPADVYDVQKCAVTDALFAAHAAAAQLRNRAARAAATSSSTPPDELSASVAWSVAVSGSGTTRSWHIARRRQHVLQSAAAAAAARQASTSRRSPEAQWRQDSAISSLLHEDRSFTSVLREHGLPEPQLGADATGPWDELWQGHNTPLRTRCGFLAMSEDKLVRDIPKNPQGVAQGAARPVMGVLVLLPWDYSTLFELLSQLHESAQAMPRAAEVAWRRRHQQLYKPGSLPLLAHAAEAEPVWRQAFTEYLERVPGYYLSPLMTALAPYCLDQVVRDCLLPPGQQDVMAGLVRCHRHMPPMEAFDWLNYAQKSTDQLSGELCSQSRVPPLEEVTGFKEAGPGDGAGASDTTSVCSTGSVSSLMSSASGYSYVAHNQDDCEPPVGGVQPTESTAASTLRHSVPAQLMSNYAQRVQHAAEHNLRNPTAEDPDADRAEALRPLFGNPYAFKAGRRPGQRGLLLGQLPTSSTTHAPADEMDMLASNDAALISDGLPGAAGPLPPAAMPGAGSSIAAHTTPSQHTTAADTSAAKLSALGLQLQRWAGGVPLALHGWSVPGMPPPANDAPPPTAVELLMAALKRHNAMSNMHLRS